MLDSIFVRASNGQQVEVRLSSETKFGPQQAIAAAEIAFGAFSHCDVVHGKKQYRVTGKSWKRNARRVK